MLFIHDCSQTKNNASAVFHYGLQNPFQMGLLNIQFARSEADFHDGFIFYLSIFNYVTTVSMFLTGISICRQVWKRGDTAEIPCYSFLLGLLSGVYWLLYGLLKGEVVVVCVNATETGIFSGYTLFYWFMSKRRLCISVKICAVLLLSLALIPLADQLGCLLVAPLGASAEWPSALGICCMALSIGSFGAPLAGLVCGIANLSKFVQKAALCRRNTSMLPLPVCIANLVMSSGWTLYGLLSTDVNLTIPNAIGMFLSSCQLLLFLALPPKIGKPAPIARLSCCHCLQPFPMRPSSPAESTVDESGPGSWRGKGSTSSCGTLDAKM